MSDQSISLPLPLLPLFPNPLSLSLPPTAHHSRLFPSPPLVVVAAQLAHQRTLRCVRVKRWIPFGGPSPTTVFQLSPERIARSAVPVSPLSVSFQRPSNELIIPFCPCRPSSLDILHPLQCPIPPPPPSPPLALSASNFTEVTIYLPDV